MTSLTLRVTSRSLPPQTTSHLSRRVLQCVRHTIRCDVRNLTHSRLGLPPISFKHLGLPLTFFKLLVLPVTSCKRIFPSSTQALFSFHPLSPLHLPHLSVP